MNDFHLGFYIGLAAGLAAGTIVALVLMLIALWWIGPVEARGEKDWTWEPDEPGH